MLASTYSSNYCIHKTLNTLVRVESDGKANYNRSVLMDTRFWGPVHKYILR